MRNEADRRQQLVRLTPAGLDLLQRAERIAATMEDEPLGLLSEAERALLNELLLKVAAGNRR